MFLDFACSNKKHRHAKDVTNSTHNPAVFKSKFEALPFTDVSVELQHQSTFHISFSTLKDAGIPSVSMHLSVSVNLV